MLLWSIELMSPDSDRRGSCEAQGFATEAALTGRLAGRGVFLEGRDDGPSVTAQRRAARPGSRGTGGG